MKHYLTGTAAVALMALATVATAAALTIEAKGIGPFWKAIFIFIGSSFLTTS